MSNFSKEIKKAKIEEVSQTFNKNILLNLNIFESLKGFCKDGYLPDELRPIAWKIFLGILPNKSDKKEWVEKIYDERMKYKKKLKKYLSLKKYKGDPLGVGTKKNERNYNTLYEENELRRIINLDIVRTFQNIDIFSQEKIKKILLNILFIWSKENEEISYRQGMNELLAILILSCYPFYFPFEGEEKPTKDDIIKYINIENEKENKEYIKKIYYYFHDENEIESDLFFVFDSLMKKGIKNLFDPRILEKTDNDYKLYELFSDIFKDDIDEKKSTYIGRRCFLLINEKLKIIDEELYKYFKKLDIDCEAFLQKWLRCIFCREFELNQVFILWDIIFLQNLIDEKNQKYSLLFMDSICLAMIIEIRNILLKRDQNGCYTLLFKYPNKDKIKEIILLAYNIYHIINERINGKKIDTKTLINFVGNGNDNEDKYNYIDKEKDDIQTPYSSLSKSTLEKNMCNKNENDNNIKNNFLGNKNIYSNINNNYYQTNTFINSAISSIGKIGSKLKDHLKTAKEAVLGLEEYEERNEETDKNENKMSDLFDLPNFNKDKEIIGNKRDLNLHNNDNSNNKDINNIIERLKRIDNKYNKFFEEEDKKELGDIINELLKQK